MTPSRSVKSIAGAAGKQVTAMSSTSDGYGASSNGGGGSGY